MLEQLEMCEKALQDYLETKRIAFPRFYFVAAADLLDILSKGSNPQLILRHLPKNFDNIHNLEFKKDENGEPTKASYLCFVLLFLSLYRLQLVCILVRKSMFLLQLIVFVMDLLKLGCKRLWTQCAKP